MPKLDLTDQANFAKVKELNDLAVEHDDIHSASRVLAILKDNVADQVDKLQENEGLYNFYRQFWIDCQFIKLPSISDEDYFDLIEESLVEGLLLPEYDIIDKIGTRISFLVYDEEKVEFAQKTVQLLENCKDALAEIPVANWLKEYRSFPSQQAQRTSLEEAEFLSKSLNASKLNDTDKGILLDILELYDSLLGLLAAYQRLKNDPNYKPDIAKLFPGSTISNEPGDGAEPASQSPLGSATEAPPAPESLANLTKLAPPIPIQPPPTVVSSRPPIVPPKPVIIPDPEPASATTAPMPRPPEPLPAPPQQARETYAIVEDETPVVPTDKNKVAEEVKQALESSKFKIPSRPLNVQDFLNERDSRNDKRGGIVFDSSPKPIATAAPGPKAAAPPPNLPTAEIPPQPLPASAPQDEIAKKLAELRKRKQP